MVEAASALSKQCASTVLMVAPHDFEFNEETSFDNEFQSRPSISPSVVNRRAMAEFEGMVELLRCHGISVLLPERRTIGPRTPDAVFPNNWVATAHDGTVLLFPMAPPGRRLEKRIDAVEAVLDHDNYLIRNIVNIGRHYETKYFLEGTGCLVIDHDNQRVFAARSERCHEEQLKNFARVRQYETIVFDTCSSTGKPIYHTNVMMSIGEKVAVICLACIPNAEQRRQVFATLDTNHEVIELSLEQVERNMCGNILQVKNTAGKRFMVMSQRAYSGFTSAQRKALLAHGDILQVSLDTIESVGGGSARCMLAEVFLPQVLPTMPQP